MQKTNVIAVGIEPVQLVGHELDPLSLPIAAPREALNDLASELRNWTIPADVVLCESGGQNLPPNSAGASGYYQFISSTWIGMGGSTANAYQAPKAEQDLLAARLWNTPGGPANWDCAKCLNYATGICPLEGQMHYATRSPTVARQS